MSKAHAKLGASTAKRWLNCAGSINLSKNAPPQISSKYAEEGTRAHELMEELLLTKVLDQKVEKALVKKYDKPTFDHVNIMRDFVYDILNEEPHAELLVEEKIDLSFVGEDMFGTVDCGIVIRKPASKRKKRLYVIDYKHGAGTFVSVEKNEQLIYYALGIAHKYDFDFDEVTLVIVQPRAWSESGEAIRQFTMTMSELKVYIELFKKGVARTKSPNARTFAGEWCKYCPAAVICPEVSKNQIQSAQLDFTIDEPSEIDLPHPQDLRPEQISKLLKASDILEGWFKDVRAYAQSLLNRGGKIDGFKLVEKRSTRIWINKDKTAIEAEELCGTDAYSDPELLSPAQLEKIAGKEWVNKRTTSVSSGLTIAPESDRRQAVNQIENDFNDNPKGNENEEETSEESRSQSDTKEKNKSGKKEGNKKASAEKIVSKKSQDASKEKGGNKKAVKAEAEKSDGFDFGF